jgi:hypothetical protein
MGLDFAPSVGLDSKTRAISIFSATKVHSLRGAWNSGANIGWNPPTDDMPGLVACKESFGPRNAMCVRVGAHDLRSSRRHIIQSATIRSSQGQKTTQRRDTTLKTTLSPKLPIIHSATILSSETA